MEASDVPEPNANARISPGDSIGRAVRTLSGLTLGSRVLGLVRDLATVRIFADTAVGSAFAAALAIPNMFRRLFGEGALSAAFLPEYARLDASDPAQASAFARTTIALLALATGSLTVLAELALLLALLLSPGDADRTLSLRLIMLTLPFMPMVCVAAILGGMLQTHGRFAPWAAAPIILNLCIIGACAPYWFIHSASPRTWGYVISASVLLAGSLQIAWSLRRLRGRVDWNAASEQTRARVKTMLARMVPALIGLGALQLNAFVDTLIAMWPLWVGDTIAGRPYPLDEASNSVLYYAQRLYQFPLGVFGIAVATAIFPELSRASQDHTRFTDLLRRGLRLSLFIALPASAGLALVRTDLVTTLYAGSDAGFSQAGVRRAEMVVLGYSVGVWAYSLNQLWTRAFYARNDTTTPMRIALAMVGLNLTLNLALVWPLGEAGLAWSTSISAMAQCVLLARAARGRLGLRGLVDAPTARSLARSLALTALMGASVWALVTFWGDRSSWGGSALALGGATLLGAGLYAGLSRAVRAPELGWILRPGRGEERPGGARSPEVQSARSNPQGDSR